MVYFCVVKGLEEPTKLVVLLQGEQSLLSLAISFFFFFLQAIKRFFLVLLSVLMQHVFYRQQVVLSLALITEGIH